MKRWLPCCAGIVLSTAALAADPQNESVRASMLVTGTIQEAPDGSVATYAIDHPESLPPAVRSLLANAIPAWKFDLLADGKAAAPKVPIAVRVVATTMAGDKVRLEIEGVHFGPPDHHPGIAMVKQEKPVYPQRQSMRWCMARCIWPCGWTPPARWPMSPCSKWTWVWSGATPS